MGPGGHFSSNITKATADGNCCCTSDVGRRYGGVLEFPPLKWKMKSQLIRGTQTTKISWFKNIVLKKFCLHFYSTPQNQFAPQTREQTFVGTFLWYEKLILGCWLWVGLGFGKKVLGQFFQLLVSKKKWKNCSVRTAKLHRNIGSLHKLRKHVFGIFWPHTYPCLQ